MHEKALEGFLGLSEEKDEEQGFIPWKLRPRCRGFSPGLFGVSNDIEGISKPRKISNKPNKLTA